MIWSDVYVPVENERSKEKNVSIISERENYEKKIILNYVNSTNYIHFVNRVKDHMSFMYY